MLWYESMIDVSIFHFSLTVRVVITVTQNVICVNRSTTPSQAQSVSVHLSDDAHALWCRRRP